MQTNNPFELILNKLEQIQTTVDIISVNSPGQNPAPTDPDRIIDLPEAAKILCKPVGTVRGYIHSRKLPARLVGKSYLIKYQELIKWFENYQAAYETESKKSATSLMMENRKRYSKDSM
ncbi:MAG: helix-turn-helix domain-containing protein [Bacteroidota bacterium]|nr:helix-turn-helix domain-containing protein [Bacteroidota bacterium]